MHYEYYDPPSGGPTNEQSTVHPVAVPRKKPRKPRHFISGSLGIFRLSLTNRSVFFIFVEILGQYPDKGK